MRLFAALALPDAVAEGLMLIQSGVPGARWSAREQLHLTLRFIGENPRALWTGVRDPAPVTHLARKIETAIQRIGLPAEQRKFVPHVTLARLRAAPHGRVLDYLTDHALYASGAFAVESFILFSSVLTDDGSIYTPEREYGLG